MVLSFSVLCILQSSLVVWHVNNYVPGISLDLYSVQGASISSGLEVLFLKQLLVFLFSCFEEWLINLSDVSVIDLCDILGAK